MSHLCQYCQRPFSRKYNKDRHEKASCWKQATITPVMSTVSTEKVESVTNKPDESQAKIDNMGSEEKDQGS